MELILKKCPSCGAGLSIKGGSKEIVCNYCNQSFIVKNDYTDLEELKENAINKINGALGNIKFSEKDKKMAKTAITIYIVAIAIFILSFSVIFFSIFGMIFR